jgi:hypothetical protein
MFSYQQTHPSRLESCLRAVQVPGGRPCCSSGAGTDLLFRLSATVFPKFFSLNVTMQPRQQDSLPYIYSSKPFPLNFPLYIPLLIKYTFPYN